MHRAYNRLITLLIFLLTSSNTLACRFAPDTRPMEQRIAEQAVVFIGTVIQSAYKGTDDIAVFNIEQRIKGIADTQQTFEVKIDKSSCSLSFVKGERWLFAGGAVFSPSVLLDARDGAQLTRLDDSKLNLQSAWQQCEADSDCTRIFYGCGEPVSINKKSHNEAQKILWVKHGDPRTTNCVTKENHKFYILPNTVCKKNICSIIQIQF